MILFCLPYAGGSKTVYYKWKNYLHPSIELISIELKGRGERINEIFYESLEEAVDDIFENIKDKITNDEYAIYGHSMGALLSYELYYKIEQMGMKKPEHIFFSGYRAPNIIRQEEKKSTLPDYDFISKVMDIGGTPNKLIENKELLEIFIPIIRSDFKILENYKYNERKNNIECNVSVLNGKQDAIKLEEILAWKNHVSKEFKVYSFEGNHFFINTNVENITNIINDTLVYKNYIERGIYYGV